MSLLTRTLISAGAYQFTSFASLKLSQTIHGHHHFEIVVSNEWFNKMGQGILTAAKLLLGQDISITITAIDVTSGYKPMIFKGIITAVNSSKETDGLHGTSIITGYSPDALLAAEPHIESFENQYLAGIVSEALKPCTRFTFGPVISPGYQQLIKYTVQYKESAYQFLDRLAEKYGEWFFYNGEQIVFGNYAAGKASLVHLRDLMEFNIGLQVQPLNMNFNGYDYRQVTHTKQTNQKVEAQTGNDSLNYAVNVSNKLYYKPADYRADQVLYGDSKAQLDKSIAIHQQGKASQLMVLSGRSKCTSLRIGDTVSIGETILASDHHGEFVVTKIEHTCNEIGKYSNYFEAIPVEVARPSTNVNRIAFSESQPAIVMENHDPKGLGRVKVRFHWQQSGMSPWIRIIQPHAGNDKGFFFIPEKGEEVWVDFEGGNPDAPFVVGTMYNGNEKTAYGDAANNVKAIRTRSGHTILLDDTEGKESITITDKNKNTILLDTQNGSIRISAPEDLLIEATNIKIAAKEDLSITGKNMNTDITEYNHIQSGKDLQLNSKEGAATISAETKLSLQSRKNDTLLTAGNNIEIKAEADMSASGGNVEVGADGQLQLASQGETSVKGKKTNIEGNANKLEIS